MPLMLDVTHQECVIKFKTVRRKQRVVVKISGTHMVDAQRLHLPFRHLEQKTV